ncbi:MAG: NAD(P)/FAD-dependent oxidoreductase [Flavisolibacter sp.]
MQISIWEKETFFAPQDVIIVGSGFAGLWSAFYLKKKNPKLKITIVERGLIPTGASTRNAGFACFGSLSEVVHDAQAMGTNKMLELVEMRYKGLERIQKHFEKEAIDFDLCGGYELYDAAEKTSSEELQHNIDYINSVLKSITGTKRTYKLTDDKIYSFGFGKTKHLVKNNLEGYLHSGKLLQALLLQVQSMGVQVFNSIEIKAFEKINDHIELVTNQPFKLSTAQLLLCTNAFTKNLFPEIDIIPARGQVVLTSPIENLSWKGTFHSDEGFYYFRNLGNRVLLGGARNKAFVEEQTTEMHTSDFIQQELEKYMHEVILAGYHGHYKIEHRWSGIMAMGSEKLPVIKELAPNVFCAVRMSGMGVALAPVVGKEIAGMMV